MGPAHAARLRRRLIGCLLALPLGCSIPNRTRAESVDASAPPVDTGAPPLDAGASSAACGLAAGSTTCGACIEAQCCSQATECAGIAACAGYESCILPCGADYACRATCLVGHSASDPSIASIGQCIAANCQTACGIECGVTTTSAAPDAAAECQQCVVTHTNACKAAGTYLRDLECEEIAACQSGCTTPDCADACMNGKDAGAALGQEALTALADSCLSVCGYGTHWGCIGKVTNPLPKESRIALTVMVNSVAPLAPPSPLSGVRVIACGEADPHCATPVAGTTDAQGNVTLSIEAGLVGFHGHLELTSPGMMPLLYFFSYYLTAQSSRLQANMVTPATLAESVSGTNVKLNLAMMGAVLVQTYDCSLQAAADVIIAPDGAGSSAKLLYAPFSALATATTAGGSGLALLVNAQKGAVAFAATPNAVHEASSHGSVDVKPGSLSFIALVPN